MANLGLQNNNPGNLRDPATGSFRTFGTIDEGNQALMDDLKIKQSGQSHVIKPGASLSDFANVWAPASDNNNPDNYANTLATHLGVDVNHPFDKVDPNKLADAIKIAEGTSTPETSAKVKMSMDDFAAKIKAKYPQYQSMDNATLTQKMLAKYPQYQSSVDTTPQTQTTTAPAPNPSFTGINPDGTPNTSIEGGTRAVPDDNTPSTAQVFGNIGKGLISGTIESGKDIAAAIGGNTMMGKFDKLAEADRNYLTTLIQLRNKAATSGDKDKVDHFQKLIKGYKTTDNETATTLFPSLNKSTEQVLGDFASMGLETVGGAEGLQGLGEATGLAAKTGAETVVPSALKKFGTAAATGAGYGGAFGAAGAAENNDSLGDIAKSTAVGAITGAATGLATEAIGSGFSKAFGAGKSAEEILATAPEDVKGLSLKEQKLWYSEQSKILNQSAREAAQNAQAAGVESNKQAVNAIQDFSSKLAETSRGEAADLKPKAQQLMKTSSAHYVELTGEAADGSPALSKTIAHPDLAAKIDSKFEYNPEIASSLKNDLGLKTTESSVQQYDSYGDKIESTPEKPQTVTNQDILNKAREIMADVSKSAKGGNKVYSAEEYQAMQKYSFLMQTLGDNGVDMTEANKFWKQWSPVRDRIVREIKPFDLEGVGKIPFESTIKKSAISTGTANQIASKLDAQNFINELETRMKLPPGTIGADTRDLMSQLEKAKLDKKTINEITTEATNKIKADKSEQTKQLGIKKYDSLSRAEASERRGKIIKNIIYATLGLGALKEIPAVGTAIKAVTGL